MVSAVSLAPVDALAPIQAKGLMRREITPGE